MSNLLEQASLVMIPSGYKEDVVYSEIPLDGSGDMAFTRASNGTRINSQGLVEVCPWNLLQYSEDFTNAFWNKATSGSATLSVTANQTTAPNGTNTADLISITRSAVSELSAVYTFVGQGIGTFKNSIWLKAKDSSNVGKTIDLWSWEGATRGYTKITLTADWVRYEQNTTVFTGSASELFDFGLLPSGFSTSTTLAVEFYVWGAQANIGSTAKPYFPTTDRLNVPRLTYQNGGGGCPSLLLEKQSTNLLLYSNQLDLWTRFTNTTKSIDNSVIDPEGNFANKYLRNSSSVAIASLDGVSISASTTYTFTYFAKKGNYSQINVEVGSGANNVQLSYNFDTGALTGVSYGSQTLISSSASSFGNGWVRITGVFTGSITSINYTIYIGSAINTYVYLYGAQLEASSYPTSYIPTTSSSATRVEDACSKTGISSLIGQTSGTLFVQWINLNNELCNLIETYNSASGITGTSSILIQKSANNQLNIRVFDSLGNYGDAFSVTMPIGTNKVALAYEPGAAIMYLNGVAIGSNSRTYVFGSTRDSIAFDNRGSYARSEVVLFPTRLTNAELASLTTI